MRIFVTGDIHRDIDYDKLKEFRHSAGCELTLDDHLIICGDFGLLWDGGRKDNYFKNNVYKDFPCTILWVDGNHENFDELYKYPVEEWRGGKIHRITDRIIHLMRGEVFDVPCLTIEEEIKTVKILAFGGAKSTDRGYDTGDNRGWWKEELPTDDEYRNAVHNLSLNGNVVDYIVTHDAPSFIVKEMLGYTRLSDPVFSGFLERLARTVSFKHWYFGHHHTDKNWDEYSCLYDSIIELIIR